ncbi:unnamed protein product [Discosporangium mesarthrocarpum]
MAHIPLVWLAFFTITSLKPVEDFCDWWSTRVCWKGFQECLQKLCPDLVVSVHPMCQHLPMRVLDTLAKEGEEAKGGVEALMREGREEGKGFHGKRRVPFVTVVTDHKAHPVWFRHLPDVLFVPRWRFLRIFLFFSVCCDTTLGLGKKMKERKKMATWKYRRACM